MSPRRPSVPGLVPFRPGRFAVLLLLGLLSAPALFAADPLAEQPPFSLSPAELLAAARPTAPDPQDVEILYRTTTFTFGADGARTLERHEVFRIGTAAGADANSEVSTDYSPWHQERPTVRARVVTPAGREHPLDPATLSEVSLESNLPDVYQDRRRIRAPLPAIEPGAVIETLVRVVDKAPLFAAGTVHRELLAGTAPIRHLEVTLDFPQSLELHHMVAHPAGAGDSSEPVTSRAGGRVRQVLELHDVEPLENPAPGLPSDEPRYPYVAFTTGRSWGNLARAYSRVVDTQIAASDLGNVEIPGGSLASQWEQIAARVAWMQRSVRYTGVNLGEAEIVPRPPAQTLARRYGDCKDKATLLVAALRDLGVPAYVALLRAGSPDDIDAELPGLGAGGFDHAIVYVPGHPALWIDATDPYSVLGELPTPDQGRLALVASPNTDHLVRTPVASADENRVEETREITLAEFGPGRVVETGEFSGAPARELRYGWDGQTEKQIADNLAQYAERSYGTASATAVEHAPADDVSVPMTTRFEVEDAQWALTDLIQGFVAIPRPNLLQRLPYAAFWQPEEGEERRSDFVIHEPHEIQWHYLIHVPDGFALRELPEDETRDLGPAHYAARFEQAGDEVRATLTLRLDAHRLSPGELATLRDRVAAFRDEGNLLLWFDQVGSSLLASGKVREAFAEDRRLATLHPDEALHRVQLARVALAAGMGVEARRQARAAVEMAPDELLAQQMLGLTLLHDLAGRQFRAGYDRAGAIAALERARELDPDEVQVAINLALLYEHDAEGARFRDPEGLAKAIEIYRDIQDDLADTQYQDNLPLALLFAERNQEAFDLLEDEASTVQELGLLAAAETLVKSPEAAVRRLGHAFNGDGGQRAQALTFAGQSLAARRHYSEAAALFKAASTSADNPAQIQGMVRLLEHARPWNEVSTDPDSPTALLYELVERTVHAEAVEPSDVADLLADVWREDLSSDAVSDFVERELEVAGPSGPAGQIFGDGGVDVVLDLFFGLGKIVATELPDVGWALRLESDLPLPDKDKGMIVVREHGGYRLAASEDHPSSLGHYAFILARRGDVDAARPWLQRAFELTEDPDDGQTLPSAEELFHRVWTSDASGDEAADRAGVEVAAAVLSADEFADEQVVEVLRKARDRATGAARQLDLDQALASALLGTEGHDDLLLEVGRRIEQSQDEDFFTDVALRRLERYDELLERFDRELEEDPDDSFTAGRRALLLIHAGRFDDAAAAYEELLSHGDPEPAAYNQAAWLALVRGAVDDQAVEWAEHAAQVNVYASWEELHTLAAVYAEADRPEEAFKVLLQAIGLHADRKLTSDDWYVLGRIAEQYDLPDTARSYYHRVEAPEGETEPDPMTTWSVTQRRLKALDE